MTATALRCTALVAALTVAAACSSSKVSTTAWCTKARAANSLNVMAAVRLSDPAALKASFTEGLTAAKDAARTAPTEIRPDAERVVATLETIGPILSTAGYDMSKAAVTPAFTKALADDAYQASLTAVGAYTSKTCGLGR